MKNLCSVSECLTRASYTDDEGVHYCHRHRKAGLQNADWKPCTNCGVVRRLYEGGKCCACRTRGFVINQPVDVVPINQPVEVVPNVNEKLQEIIQFLNIHQKGFIKKRPFLNDCERMASLVDTMRLVFSKFPEMIECQYTRHSKYDLLEGLIMSALKKKKQFEIDCVNKLQNPEYHTNGFLTFYQELMELTRQSDSVIYDYLNRKYSFVLFRTNRDVYRHVLSFLVSPRDTTPVGTTA